MEQHFARKGGNCHNASGSSMGGNERNGEREEESMREKETCHYIRMRHFQNLMTMCLDQIYDIAVKILTCVSKAFLTQKKPMNNNPKFVSHLLRHSVYHIYVILFPPHYFVFILLII